MLTRASRAAGGTLMHESGTVLHGSGAYRSRDGPGRESGQFWAFRLVATRSSDGRNLAWFGDFRQKKGLETIQTLVIGGVQFTTEQLAIGANGHCCGR